MTTSLRFCTVTALVLLGGATSTACTLPSLDHDGTSPTDDGGSDDGGSDDGGSDDGGSDEVGGADDSGGTDDGHADESSDGGDSGDTGDGTTLAPSVFLYVHREGDYASSVHAFDTATNEDTVYAAFDGMAEIHGIAIRPDRRGAAISSSYGTGLGEASAIDWMPADGSASMQLMAPLPAPQGADTSYSQSLRSLAYSPDGASIWMDHGSIQNAGDQFIGGSALARLGADGYEEFLAANGGCQLASHPSPSPDGMGVLAVRANCTDSAATGIVGWTGDPQDAGNVVVSLTQSQTKLATPRWLPDGSAVVFLANLGIDGDGDGVEESNGDALLVLDDELHTLLPPAPDVVMWDFAIAPDGTHLALCMRTDNGTDLVLLDVSGETATATALTTDGASCYPAW